MRPSNERYTGSFHYSFSTFAKCKISEFLVSFFLWLEKVEPRPKFPILTVSTYEKTIKQAWNVTNLQNQTQHELSIGQKLLSWKNSWSSAPNQFADFFLTLHSFCPCGFAPLVVSPPLNFIYILNKHRSSSGGFWGDLLKLPFEAR